MVEHETVVEWSNDTFDGHFNIHNFDFLLLFIKDMTFLFI